MKSSPWTMAGVYMTHYRRPNGSGYFRVPGTTAGLLIHRPLGGMTFRTGLKKTAFHTAGNTQRYLGKVSDDDKDAPNNQPYCKKANNN